VDGEQVHDAFTRAEETVMNTSIGSNDKGEGITLVLGGTGKTGRRVADRLRARGLPTRIGSRSAPTAFDWDDTGTWDAALDGVRAVYVTYAPDLAIPGATDAIRAFVDRAVAKGVRRLVLLSGRGEEEAQACERIVQASGIEWTVVRASWFNQNFSEGAFLEMVLAGEITLPAGEVPEPFVDADDIADVAVAALTEDGHAYEIYELTGPRMLSFAEIAREISRAAGREVRFVPIPQEAFMAAVGASGAPDDVAWMLNYLFETVLDGRNTYLCDGVQRALGRAPTDFSEYARRIAATGVWGRAAAEVSS
jgi:uncharacterized protein YbjT (DUF2867 family)